MKREYLKELGLEDEIIDKVLAENGKDIEREKGKAEAAKADAENLKTQLADRDKDLEEPTKTQKPTRRRLRRETIPPLLLLLSPAQTSSFRPRALRRRSETNSKPRV